MGVDFTAAVKGVSRPNQRKGKKSMLWKDVRRRNVCKLFGRRKKRGPLVDP